MTDPALDPYIQNAEGLLTLALVLAVALFVWMILGKR